MKEKITVRAKGRWDSILVELGFEKKLLNRREHKCPAGGGATFRYSNKHGNGNFFCDCNPEGKGDGFALIRCCRGVEFKDAAVMVEEVIGRADEDGAIDSAAELERARKDLKAIASQVREMDGRRDAVLEYLEGRGIPRDRVPAALKQASTAYALRAIGLSHRRVAMVAPYYAPGMVACTFHLTYIEGGKKANHERAKVVATPVVEMAGGCVPMFKPENGIIGVAEGIETALSAHILYGIPVNATLNANMMAKWEIPKGLKELHIFADNDASFTGQAAAYALAKTAKVIKKVPVVHVHIPSTVGDDFNDMLRKVGA